TTQRLEQPLAPVGHGHLVAAPPGLPRRPTDGVGHLGRRRRPPELVGRGHHPHPPSVADAPERPSRRPARRPARPPLPAPRDGARRGAGGGGPGRFGAMAQRPVVIVSNRGPVSFRRGDDGELVAKRGAGGLVSGIGPLVAGTGATWIAAAMS